MDSRFHRFLRRAHCTRLPLALIVSTIVGTGVRFCPMPFFITFHPFRGLSALIIALAPFVFLMLLSSTAAYSCAARNCRRSHGDSASKDLLFFLHSCTISASLVLLIQFRSFKPALLAAVLALPPSPTPVCLYLSSPWITRPLSIHLCKRPRCEPP